MTSNDRKVGVPTPLYIVAAPLGPDGAAFQPAFIPDEPQSGTFDEALLPALIGIHYAMHLPKNRFETLDLQIPAIRDQVVGFPRGHSIALIPDVMLDEAKLMAVLTAPYEPALILAPSDRIKAAQTASRQVGSLLPPAAFETLGQSSLDEHWRLLASRWLDDWPRSVVLEPATPRWSWPIRQDGSFLSLQRLARMMAVPLEFPKEQGSPFRSAAHVRGLRIHLEALAELEHEGVDIDSAEAHYPLALEKKSNMRMRLTMSLSGTAPRYVRFSSGADGITDGVFRDDYPEVRALMVSHAASADNSMGIVLEDVLTPEAFHAVAALERHWSEVPRPGAVRRLFQRLNNATESFWTDEMVAAIRCASSIEVFTNFPLGLLTLPGDSSPICNRLPISYRPINPLTRALQFELIPQAPHLLNAGFKVLVAECIPSSDPVGAASRVGWARIADEMEAAGIDFTISETLTRVSLREAITASAPDVLILSAHGFHASEQNVAGIIIGEDERSLGDDFGAVPPLVILSACHTSPRGGGVVNIGDLLIRAGAVSVLSTLVPVNVFHNTQIVARFLRYVALAVNDSATPANTSVMDVWHQVQALNVVIDLVHGNRKLMEWAFTRVNGTSPIEQFMTGDHGMRRTHLYQDAEARLVGIAARTSDEQRVRGWLRSPGYVPESLMYTMLGRPSFLLVGAPTDTAWSTDL
ncbi:CHAT domain-containing protein [Pseudoclavibacter sp. CFCC 11306]|uniref:CHAT domain-containing protein n=1 Tax=Pseudoclavibacter sp. CFCC 11306 TaxID=1564493 RepID=UPI001300F7B0|nr:CHAT domain-containing protein [Pseudoclavibacter sp. CFCC 11306]KAB1658140.1 CHAT domain-containing protein [Pseudoclavibacter sp. CFCC 11306]